MADTQTAPQAPAGLQPIPALGGSVTEAQEALLSLLEPEEETPETEEAQPTEVEESQPEEEDESFEEDTEEEEESVEEEVSETVEAPVVEEVDMAEVADIEDWRGLEIRVKNLEDAIADLKADKENKVEASEIEVNDEVELSAIKHNPESKNKVEHRSYAQNRPMNTQDRVFARLFNNN